MELVSQRRIRAYKHLLYHKLSKATRAFILKMAPDPHNKTACAPDYRALYRSQWQRMPLLHAPRYHEESTIGPKAVLLSHSSHSAHIHTHTHTGAFKRG